MIRVTDQTRDVICLLAILLAAGCGRPESDLPDASDSRLTSGVEAIVLATNFSPPKGRVPSFVDLHDVDGKRPRKFLPITVGTRVRVASDEREANAEDWTEPDGDQTKVDRRLVQVEIQDGPHKGVKGCLFRHALLPVQSSANDR